MQSEHHVQWILKVFLSYWRFVQRLCAQLKWSIYCIRMEVRRRQNEVCAMHIYWLNWDHSLLCHSHHPFGFVRFSTHKSFRCCSGLETGWIAVLSRICDHDRKSSKLFGQFLISSNLRLKIVIRTHFSNYLLAARRGNAMSHLIWLSSKSMKIRAAICILDNPTHTETRKFLLRSDPST